MSDYINTLPTDDDPLNPSESNIMNIITGKDGSGDTAMLRILNEMKIPIVIGILFLLVSTSQFTDILRTCIPFTGKNDTHMLMMKTVVFIILVFVLMNCSVKLTF